MRKIPIEVAAVVLAGGKGTRLYPLTIHHAKPAISYGGRYRLIDIPISNAINSGISQIFVIAQYLSAELQHHIQQTYHFDSFHPGSVDVLTPEEKESGEKNWFQGTADAVRKNLPTLLKSPAKYFLILSGDQLYNIDFHTMLEFAQKAEADLTIASLFVEEKEAKRMGLLKTDPQGKVVDFCEKPQKKDQLTPFAIEKEGSFPLYLGSMGIYVFTRQAILSLLTEDLRDDFGFHLINTAVKKGKTFAFVYDGYWEDIGTVGSYHQANLILAQENQGLDTYDETNPIYTRPTYLPGPKIDTTLISRSIICEGSLIEAKEITNSVIGLRSRIGKGTIIRDSVLMGNHFYMPPLGAKKGPPIDFGIGENCLIEKAIIDEHVQIGNNVSLINERKVSHYDGQGLFVRDGIIIIASGTRLPDGFIF